MNLVKKTIEGVKAHYHLFRRSGTTTFLNKVAEEGSDVLKIVSFQEMKKDYSGKVMSLSEIREGQTSGIKPCPYVYDANAIYAFADLCESEIESLENDVRIQKEKVVDGEKKFRFAMALRDREIDELNLKIRTLMQKPKWYQYKDFLRTVLTLVIGGLTWTIGQSIYFGEFVPDGLYMAAFGITVVPFIQFLTRNNP